MLYKNALVAYKIQCWRDGEYSQREFLTQLTKKSMWIDWEGYWYKCKSLLLRIVTLATLKQKKQNHSQVPKIKGCWTKQKKIFKPQSIENDSVKVFLNESLCDYYMFCWSKCKNLWTEEWIEYFL